MKIDHDNLYRDSERTVNSRAIYWATESHISKKTHNLSFPLSISAKPTQSAIMRLLRSPSALLSFLAISASLPSSTFAIEFLRARSIPRALGAMMLERRCANPCGYYSQVCCESNQQCLTVNNEAVCGQAQTTGNTLVAGGGNGYQMFTTTYTGLTTVTSTYSLPISQTTQALVATCQAALYETQCGTTCCTPEETCVNNCCVANGGGSSVYYGSPATSFYTVTATSQAGTPPYRPTSSGVITVTSTGLATTTQSFIAPVGTDGSTLIGTSQSSGGGLSGGAIAGIVIGVIAGIILLLLICACCCFKGLIDGVLAIFGLGPRSRRRRTEETIEERRHSSGNVGRRTWFGTRPSRPDRRNSGGGGIGLAGVGAALATLAVVLGLKRRHDRKHDEKSSYSSSYYDSEYTSSSEYTP